jgi:SAM-dependent methyltransferase
MTESIAGRIHRYILDGSDDDLRRLLTISELSAPMARTAVGWTKLPSGARVIECGCGPLGALTVLADVVGPGGRVTGVDFNERAIGTARSVVASLQLGNVDLVMGDIHDLDPAALGAPFDLAYTRCFLMHQRDPGHTLRRIGALLRPGGFLVAQEPVRRPAPHSHPHLDALSDYWELILKTARLAGVPNGAVEDLPRLAESAGFEVIRSHGWYDLLDPILGFDLHAGTLAAARDRVTSFSASRANAQPAMRAPVSVPGNRARAGVYGAALPGQLPYASL